MSISPLNNTGQLDIAENEDQRNYWPGSSLCSGSVSLHFSHNYFAVQAAQLVTSVCKKLTNASDHSKFLMEGMELDGSCIVLHIRISYLRPAYMMLMLMLATDACGQILN